MSVSSYVPNDTFYTVRLLCTVIAVRIILF
jgi:hypothetical protein